MRSQCGLCGTRIDPDHSPLYCCRYTGGVGSFLLLLMAMRVLQVCNRDGARGALELDPSLGETANGGDTNGEGHKRRKKKKKKKKQKQRDSSGPEAVAARAAEISKESGTNLGMLLLAFLELYGHSLNFVKTGLSVQGNGCFYSKRDRQWCVSVPCDAAAASW